MANPQVEPKKRAPRKSADVVEETSEFEIPEEVKEALSMVLGGIEGLISKKPFYLTEAMESKISDAMEEMVDELITDRGELVELSTSEANGYWARARLLREIAGL